MDTMTGATGEPSWAAALRNVAMRDLGVSPGPRLDKITETLVALSKRAGRMSGADAHVAANQTAAEIRNL